MPRDYEDVFNLDDMSDDDLASLVREEFEQYETLDADSILVRVRDGVVTLSGRVGTEAMRRIAEHVLTDVIGVTRFDNRLAVDPIRRDMEPEAADDEVAEEATRDGMLGDYPLSNESDTADAAEPDDDARLYGTHDVQKSIGRGMSWDPPDTPTPEGLSGENPDPESMGEEH